jgi:hypothetical protein
MFQLNGGNQIMMNRQSFIRRLEAGDETLATTGASFAPAKPLAAKNAPHDLGFEASAQAAGFRRLSAAGYQDRILGAFPWKMVGTKMGFRFKGKPGNVMRIFCRERLLIAIAVMLLLCSTSTRLLAQASSGAVAQISGSVSDPAGAVVPGAQVTATQTSTGFTRVAVTGGDGSYVLPDLSIGPYKLQVVGSGFKTYSQTGIVLQVSDSVTVNIKLQIGSASQSITVSADASMVNTESSSVSTVIENNRVVDLPLNGRNLTQLVLLAGAAVSTNFGDYLSSKNYPTSLTIQVAGGEAAGTGYVVDGGGAYNDLYGGSNLPLPFPDAIQEFSVQTSMIPAQFGGFPGGVVNLVTMSGTNNFHGDLFEFIRNGDVDAINYFATAQDTLRRNQFGGVLGGPVLTRKLFFLADIRGRSLAPLQLPALSLSLRQPPSMGISVRSSHPRAPASRSP